MTVGTKSESQCGMHCRGVPHDKPRRVSAACLTMSRCLMQHGDSDARWELQAFVGQIVADEQHDIEVASYA